MFLWVTTNLFYHCYQGDQCHQLASKLMEQYPEIDTPILTEAAQYVREKNVPKAVEILKVIMTLQLIQ